MMRRKLKLGLWLDAMTVPAWAYAMLERLHGSPFAEIQVIICPVPAPCPRPRWQWRTLVYDMFHALDQRLWQMQPDAFAPRHLHMLLKELPLHEVRPVWRDGHWNLAAADLEAINPYDLDVLIDLGCGEPMEALDAAPTRYGVWRYRHGIDHGVPGFWEVMRQQAVTYTQVELHLGSGASKQVVFRSAAPTYPWSPARNRQDVSWKSVAMLPRELERLHRLGADVYFARIREIPQEAGFDTPHRRGIPSNTMMLVLMIVYVARLLGRLLQKLCTVEQWFLLYDVQPHVATSLHQFQTLRPPKDRLWADPHVVVQDGRYYLFFEELMHSKGRGHISLLILGPNGRLQGPPQIVLERHYHLSYPHLLTYGGKLYMIPETKQNHTIELYECVAFPDVWRHRMNLMEDVQAVDTTVLFYQGMWWLFTSLTEHEAAPAGDELFLFYANDLFTTEWHPHPLNPIVSDVRKARPAGGILQMEGGTKLYRPSQNSAVRYGHGWNLHEIVVLTENAYEEKTVRRVQPDWDRRLLGTHSFAYAAGLTVIDGLKRRLKLG
ncbi:glucosamine inositolphosphorylceramide transferase family protein [Candidatus Entotheonella palauensis]|uniref:glucosamine inositolphosphorylceramide transferase family protein n=1 Tax=Candidatus Entotheonella palauensis TaxID=93172 RepID=UPI000B7E79E3|nr:hypothetical protein [Candidatus Entotheonella palauensis]